MAPGAVSSSRPREEVLITRLARREVPAVVVLGLPHPDPGWRCPGVVEIGPFSAGLVVDASRSVATTTRLR